MLSPKINVSTDILNFGYITIDLPLEKRFSLKNLHCEEVHWQLFEFTYDFDELKITEIENSDVLPRSGIFRKYGETIDITYRVNAKVIFFC